MRKQSRKVESPRRRAIEDCQRQDQRKRFNAKTQRRKGAKKENRAWQHHAPTIEFPGLILEKVADDDLSPD
ncbi:MAG: hypothetical protein ABI700_21655 [Chloroflexota bacterium]